jgi:hypothetical protein
MVVSFSMVRDQSDTATDAVLFGAERIRRIDANALAKTKSSQAAGMYLERAQQSR